MTWKSNERQAKNWFVYQLWTAGVAQSPSVYGKPQSPPNNSTLNGCDGQGRSTDEPKVRACVKGKRQRVDLVASCRAKTSDVQFRKKTATFSRIPDRAVHLDL